MADDKAFLGPAPSYKETDFTPLAAKLSRDYGAANARLSESPRHREYYFFNGNGITSKARIQSSDGSNYRLRADLHRNKPSSIQVQESRGSHTASLATLIFPPTHNDFQIRIPDTRVQMVQVKAKVGHPHPNAYAFTLPAATATHARKVVWKRSGNASKTTGYLLHDEFTDEVLASCSLSSGMKPQTALRWRVEPSCHLEEIIVMLSFLGVASRLRLRGKDHEGLPSGMLRYNGFWLMAILGTAAVG